MPAALRTVLAAILMVMTLAGTALAGALGDAVAAYERQGADSALGA